MTERIRAFFRSMERCRLCYADRSPIVVATPAVVPARVRIVLVGEQPPREPAAASANGAGPREHPDRLTSYLERSGVNAEDVLHVTAVLCVPLDESLRPARPSAAEVKNCSTHLRTLLERVQPKLVIPLGHTGLLALQFAFREWTELRQFILNYDVGGVLSRDEWTVYPLYLPSSTTLRARPEGRQLRDWQRIPALLETLEKAARTG